MTTDLREALHDAAATPSRDVDVDALLASAHKTKRNRFVAAAVVGLVIVAASGIALAVRDSSDSSNLAIRAGGDDSPEGWQRIDSADHDFSIAIPPEWTPVPVSNTRAPVDLVVGTVDAPAGEDVIICPPASGLSGTWVSVTEYPSESELVAATPLPHAPVTQRPVDFTHEDAPIRVACGTSGEQTDQSALFMYAFVDGGRYFMARVVTSDIDTSTGEVEVAQQVLNTLRVEPLAPAEATTTTAPTVIPPLPATTVPAETGPVSDDEAAIRNAFEQWIYVSPRDAIEPYVEDAASILDAWRQGIAQQPTGGSYEHYRIRVDSVNVVDETHADVVYSLLYDGRPQYDHVPAAAIRIDGSWKVTRDTVCSILSHGGITCPPRA